MVSLIATVTVNLLLHMLLVLLMMDLCRYVSVSVMLDPFHLLLFRQEKLAQISNVIVTALSRESSF